MRSAPNAAVEGAALCALLLLPRVVECSVHTFNLGEGSRKIQLPFGDSPPRLRSNARRAKEADGVEKGFEGGHSAASSISFPNDVHPGR
jgi:hypothetical protein